MQIQDKSVVLLFQNGFLPVNSFYIVMLKLLMIIAEKRIFSRLKKKKELRLLSLFTDLSLVIFNLLGLCNS